MSKLTKEVLSAYLPWNTYYTLTNGKTIIEMRSIDTGIKAVDFGWGNAVFYEEYGLNFKLCLRPLSDLTKEIEHNGERFVPIEWFEIGDDENCSLEYDYGNIKLIRSLESLSKHGFVNDINYIPFGVVQKLLSWHFDIFGLIKSGDAVNLNEIEK